MGGPFSMAHTHFWMGTSYSLSNRGIRNEPTHFTIPLESRLDLGIENVLLIFIDHIDSFFTFKMYFFLFRIVIEYLRNDKILQVFLFVSRLVGRYGYPAKDAYTTFFNTYHFQRSQYYNL